ncbi:UNVERIFIED_CONTAM: hypothetical protein FKN15_010428 [Acipenser sinensis]
MEVERKKSDGHPAEGPAAIPMLVTVEIGDLDKPPNSGKKVSNKCKILSGQKQEHGENKHELSRVVRFTDAV